MASTKVKIEFDKIKYLGNIKRGGLYEFTHTKIDAYNCTEYYFKCIMGKALESNDSAEKFVQDLIANEKDMERLIENRNYTPLFNEKEALAWKLKNGL